MSNQLPSRAAKKTSAVSSRRKRGKEKLNKPIWVYLNPNEREVIDKAAEIERRSSSSFVADAALDKALQIIRIYNQTVSAADRKHKQP
jgi:uncharacterized protein (DUF1778 family)